VATVAAERAAADADGEEEAEEDVSPSALEELAGWATEEQAVPARPRASTPIVAADRRRSVARVRLPSR